MAFGPCRDEIIPWNQQHIASSRFTMAKYGSVAACDMGSPESDSAAQTQIQEHDDDEENSTFPLLTRRATSQSHRQLHRQQQDEFSSSIRRLSSLLPPVPSDSSTTSASSSSSASSHQLAAHSLFQNALRLALAAYEYGCVGYRIEVFLEQLLLDQGYDCSILVTNVELIASVYSYRWKKKRSTKAKNHKRKESTKHPISGHQNGGMGEHDDEELQQFLPITIAVPLREGADLFKLGELSSVCHEVRYSKIPLALAVEKLEIIEETEFPYSLVTRWLAYVGTSIGFVAILGGSWIDLCISIFGSTMTFAVIQVFTAYFVHDTIQRLHVTWQNFFAAFFPAFVASIVSEANLFHSSINVGTITLSCIISEVPGFMLLKSISELSRNRILAGFGHFMGALFISFWLGLGGWVGIESVQIVMGHMPNVQLDAATPIDKIWLYLFGPVLCCSFALFFNVGRQDLLPATLVGLLALCMTVLIPSFPNESFGNFFAAFATSLVSHLWSYCSAPSLQVGVEASAGDIRPQKPESIVGLPAFFTLACGSLGRYTRLRWLSPLLFSLTSCSSSKGFLGFLGILEGDSASGTQAFLRMLTFTFMLVFGVYVGGTVSPTKAVLNAW